MCQALGRRSTTGHELLRMASVLQRANRGRAACEMFENRAPSGHGRASEADASAFLKMCRDVSCTRWSGSRADSDGRADPAEQAPGPASEPQSQTPAVSYPMTLPNASSRATALSVCDLGRIGFRGIGVDRPGSREIPGRSLVGLRNVGRHVATPPGDVRNRRNGIDRAPRPETNAGARSQSRWFIGLCRYGSRSAQRQDFARAAKDR